MVCWNGFTASDQLVQFCQWKCLELSLQINLARGYYKNCEKWLGGHYVAEKFSCKNPVSDTFTNYSLVGKGTMGDVYRVIKKDTNKTFGNFKFSIRTFINGKNLAIKIVPISNEEKEDKVTDYFDLLLGLSSDLSPKGIFVSQVYAVFPHCSSVLFGKLGKNNDKKFLKNFFLTPTLAAWPLRGHTALNPIF